MTGLGVLVIDPDPRARAALCAALARRGMHAVGAHAPVDAVALLDGISAELVVVRATGAEADVAVAWLKTRTLLVQIARNANTDEAVQSVLRALGQPAAGEPFN